MTVTDIATRPTNDVAQSGDWFTIARIVEQKRMIQECMSQVMTEGQHFGTIPGTPKPSLWKPGAETLGFLFRLDPEYDVIRHEVRPDFISYTVKCTLFHIPTGQRVASGLGSCNSREEKYRRAAPKKCPACGKETIFRSKQRDGEWYCWDKKGGCGKNYRGADAKAIEDQPAVIADPADLDNTLIKMACKRSHVGAILAATAASDFFTQDLEDLAGKAAEYTHPEDERPEDVVVRASYRAAVQDSPGATATKPASPPSHAAPSSTAPPRGVTSQQGAAVHGGAGEPRTGVISAPSETAPPSPAGKPCAAHADAGMNGGNGCPLPAGHAGVHGAGLTKAGKPRIDSGAMDIRHDGNKVSPGQLSKIHALRDKSPKLSATPNDPKSDWRKKLAPYRREDGKPCEHTNELSYAQASHLIDWMQAKADALEAAEREIRAKESPAVPADDIIAPASFVDQLQGIFQGVQEDHDEWLASIGYESTDDVPEASRLPVLQLAAAMKRDAPTYTVWLARAIDQGHIRQIPPRGAL